MAGRELLVNPENSANLTRTIGIAAGVVVGSYVLRPLIVAAFRAIGFTAVGVAKGSFAALIQGPVTAARSLFAIAQSIGARGSIGLDPMFLVVLGFAIAYSCRK